MPVDVKDLPPAYQAQALRKLIEQERKKGRGAALSPAADAPPKASKYHNKSTERVTASGAVLRFDSQKEAHRYDELAALERAGQIRDLRLQVDFTLQEAYTDSEGRRVRAIRYRADFSYRQKPNGQPPSTDMGELWDILEMKWPLVVEDVKSRATRTKEYIMKRKMMKDRFNIDIQEENHGTFAVYLFALLGVAGICYPGRHDWRRAGGAGESLQAQPEGDGLPDR